VSLERLMNVNNRNLKSSYQCVAIVAGRLGAVIAFPAWKRRNTARNPLAALIAHNREFFEIPPALTNKSTAECPRFERAPNQPSYKTVDTYKVTQIVFVLVRAGWIPLRNPVGNGPVRRGSGPFFSCTGTVSAVGFDLTSSISHHWLNLKLTQIGLILARTEYIKVESKGLR
jgi:hypothetical protein